MYTEKDYETIDRQWKRFWIYAALGMALFAAGFVLCLLMRWRVAGYVVSTLWAIAMVSAWGLVGARIRKYRHWMLDLRSGIARRLAGEVVSVEGPVSLVGELEFMEVEVRPDGEEGEGEPRRVYYDVQRLPLPFDVRDHVELVTSGNYIQDILHT
jgi:hypothetical protein